MEKIWTYLVDQAPVVVFMSLVVYGLYRHFTSELKRVNLKIDNKDSEIKQLNRESKEDLQNTFLVLQDVTSTLKAWIIKDENNFELKKGINKSLVDLQTTSSKILEKLK